jgi:hypothetical protein
MFQKQCFALILWAFNSCLLNAQIINIEDKRVALGDSIAIKGFGDVGVSLYRNDKQLTTAKANLQLEYINRRHFVLLLSGYNLIHTEGSPNVLNDGFSHLRYNFDVKKGLVYEAFGQVQYNERTLILFRGLIGTGIRLKLNKGKKQRYYLGISYLLEQNQFKGKTERTLDNRLSSYLSYNISFGNKSRFAHTTYVQPRLDNWQNIRVSSEASLLFVISKHLTFRTTFNTAYDSDPRLPPSVPDWIYTLTNGLRFEF